MKNIMTTNAKQIILWTQGETTLLLDNYAAYMSEVGPMKKFKTKKLMWEQLSADVDGKTAKQCEERFKTVMKRKKAAVENNCTSGSKRQCVEFQKELENIAALDDSIEPEVQLSSQQMITKGNKALHNKPPRARATATALTEIANKKEENKERRHRERMEAADKVYSLLEKLVNKSTKD